MGASGSWGRWGCGAWGGKASKHTKTTGAGAAPCRLGFRRPKLGFPIVASLWGCMTQ